MRPTICSLFEPHYKQNPYANPKRTAKILFVLFARAVTLRLYRYTENALRSKSFLILKSIFPSYISPKGTTQKARHYSGVPSGRILILNHHTQR
jgi:hypothetical protein